MTEAQRLTSGVVRTRHGVRRLRDNRAALAAAAIIVVLALLALFGPWLSPYSYDALDWQHLAAPPGLIASHWLGTDPLGRDLYVRTLYGLRLSLLIGVLATAVSVGIGVAWGAIAGYVGGRADSWMMRAVDVLYALPYLFVVIILATVFDRGSVAMLLLAIGAVGWLTMARVVRGQTLSLKRREFIEAARATGLGTPAILLRHIVPNLAGTVAVYATLTIPELITYESFLSFLGLGVQEPRASLGSLINEGARQMLTAPWMLLVPAAVLVAAAALFQPTRGWPARCARSRCALRRRARARCCASRSLASSLPPRTAKWPPSGTCRSASSAVSAWVWSGSPAPAKRQLFLATLGLLPATARVTGSASLGGAPLIGRPQRELDRIRGARIGLVFQDPMTSLTPHLRVGEQIAEPIVRHLGASWGEARRKALALLDRVRVPDAARRLRQYPHELSGGMRQRVMIAIALACEPRAADRR